jgi:hypothetical protein
VWEFTYVDGTQALLCTRHKRQAARAGGKCRSLKDLPPFEFFEPTVEENTAEFVKPAGLMQHITNELRGEVLRAVHRELEKVVVEVRFAQEIEGRRVKPSASKTRRAS